MRKIYFIVLMALSLSAQSCLMEDKNLFDNTAAERLQAYMTECSDVLTSSENGWIFEYYPEANQSYGGFVYVVKFTKGDVTAYFELANDVKVPVTSLYKITGDDGASLTFDTYNDYLHYFATPDGQNYQGMEGDYEFSLMGVSPDKSEVYLRGRRTNNKMTLRRLKIAPAVYLQNVLAMKAALKGRSHKLVIDGATNTSCKFETKANIFSYSYTIGDKVESGEMAFCQTDTGIRFYRPLVINGVEYDSLRYENSVLSSSDGKVFISWNKIIG